MRRVLTAVLALLLASTLVACGDDEGGGGEGATEARYARQANAVCSRVTNELNERFGEGQFPVVRSQVPAFVAEVAPIVSKGMDDLQAVPPPGGDLAKVARIRRAAGVLGDRFERATKDEAQAQRIFQEEGGFHGLRKVAKEHGGLLACETIGEEEEESGEATKVDPATLPAEKRTYIEKVDAICLEADKENDKIDQELAVQGFPPSLESWAKALPQFAGLGRERIFEIKKLPPPEGDTAIIDSLIADQEQILTDLEEAGRVAGTGNEEALIPLLQQLFPKFEELDQRLRQYGFQVCGAEDEDEEE